MEKREAEFKSAVFDELKRVCPAYIVLMIATAGAPDREVVGGGKTSRWEFKHGTPDFESQGLQELTCQRLAVQGHCRYVIFQETSSGLRQRTMIAHPREVAQRNGALVVPETFVVGFDPRWVVDQIRKVHRGLC
jgi:hypothetical protein